MRVNDRRPPRGGRAAIALLFASPLWLIAPAARGALSTEVASNPAPAGSFGAGFATCPVGTQALSGGTDVDNVLSMWIAASAPVFGPTYLIDQPDGSAPAPTTWYGAAQNHASGTLNVKFAAICSSEISPTTMVASWSVAAAGSNGGIVHCPLGTVAIGGGVDVENILHMLVTGSGLVFAGDVGLLLTPDGTQPAPIGWSGYVRNEDSVPHAMKVAAICSSAVAATAVVGSASVNSGSFGGVNVPCPVGADLIGGGIEPGNVFSVNVTSSAPLFAGPTPFLAQQPDGTASAPIGWSAYAVNGDFSVQPVKVAAICPEPDGGLAGASLLGAAMLLSSARRRARRGGPAISLRRHSL